jgi:hypothetical protein
VLQKPSRPALPPGEEAAATDAPPEQETDEEAEQKNYTPSRWAHLELDLLRAQTEKDLLQAQSENKDSLE